jgi:ABC-type dipeptide/oligopeptide/nickel transport system ATPase subunit
MMVGLTPLCLTLVTNAAVLWTTTYLAHALDAVRAEGFPVTDESTAARQVGAVGHGAGVVRRRRTGHRLRRAAPARAVGRPAANPRLVILDEAVAALDVSIQAQILNLLADIRAQRPVSYLFITHDLAVVNQIADRVVVMEQGKVVEEGQTAQVLAQPGHEYPRALIAAVPRPGWKPRRRATLAAAPTA